MQVISGCGYVPIKLYLQRQSVGQYRLVGCSSPTPNLAIRLPSEALAFSLASPNIFSGTILGSYIYYSNLRKIVWGPPDVCFQR